MRLIGVFSVELATLVSKSFVGPSARLFPFRHIITASLRETVGSLMAVRARFKSTCFLLTNTLFI